MNFELTYFNAEGESVDSHKKDGSKREKHGSMRNWVPVQLHRTEWTHRNPSEVDSGTKRVPDPYDHHGTGTDLAPGRKWRLHYTTPERIRRKTARIGKTAKDMKRFAGLTTRRIMNIIRHSDTVWETIYDNDVCVAVNLSKLPVRYIFF